MSIFQNYLILFLGSTYIGVTFLSWLQVCYLHNRASDWLNGFKITLMVTSGLVVAILSIVYFQVKKPQQICEKCKDPSYSPTDEDRTAVLKMTKRLHIVTLVATVVGFLCGNLISMSISIIKGAIPADPLRIAIVVAQSCTSGAAATLYTIHAMDSLMGRHLSRLHIKQVTEQSGASSISAKLGLAVIIAVLYVALNVSVVPYQMVVSTSADSANYTRYVTHACTVMLGSFFYCLPPLVIILWSLRSRIKQNADTLNKLANDGNLTSRLDVELIDDLGYLTGTINRMMDQVAEMVNAFRQESSVVSTSAQSLEQLSKSSSSAISEMGISFDRIESESFRQEQLVKSVDTNVQDLRHGTGDLEKNILEQSSAIQQNSASIEQMVSSIGSVADMTRRASELSNTLAQTSGRGNELIKQAVDSINQIHEASAEVQQIVKVIQSIASQTNLLSMNAAIEAAHAGSFGAGFAVVADEVRSLASSSSSSTGDIQKRIKDMAQKIDGGVHAITEAGAAFQQIADCVAQNQKLMQTISDAMSEQRITAEQTMRVTESVTQALEETNSLVHRQVEYVDNVKDAMAEVVKSSGQVAAVIAEGKASSSNLLSAMEQVVQSVVSNKASVNRMNKEINSFEL